MATKHSSSRSAEQHVDMVCHVQCSRAYCLGGQDMSCTSCNCCDVWRSLLPHVLSLVHSILQHTTVGLPCCICETSCTDCSFLLQEIEQQSDQQRWCCQNAEHARSAVCCCDFIACICHKFAGAMQSASAKPRTGQITCRSCQACWEGCCRWPGGLWPAFSQGCNKMSCSK